MKKEVQQALKDMTIRELMGNVTKDVSSQVEGVSTKLTVEEYVEILLERNK